MFQNREILQYESGNHVESSISTFQTRLYILVILALNSSLNGVKYHVGVTIVDFHKVGNTANQI